MIAYLVKWFYWSSVLLFGRLVSFSAIWFSIHTVLWIRSNVPARPHSIKYFFFQVKIARDRYRGLSDRRDKLEEVRKHQVNIHLVVKTGTVTIQPYQPYYFQKPDTETFYDILCIFSPYFEQTLKNSRVRIHLYRLANFLLNNVNFI